MRIVSLLPAATDLVVTLGLTDALVGRTHECDWPPGALEHGAVVTRTSLVRGVEVLAHVPHGVGALSPGEAVRLR